MVTSPQRQQGYACRCLFLNMNMNMCAIVFTMGSSSTIDKIEAFMPPYEGLAPHAHMFVAQLSMMCQDESFVTRILTEAFEAKYSGTEQRSIAKYKKPEASPFYKNLQLKKNQVALVFDINTGRDSVTHSWIAMSSFHSEKFPHYLFIEYLCRQATDDSFFQWIVFEGFNKNLFDSLHHVGKKPTGTGYDQVVALKENQIAIVLVRDKHKDSISQAVTVAPGAISKLSDVYVFVRSLSLLARQEYFFKKTLFNGFEKLMIQGINFSPDMQAGYSGTNDRILMLSKRQFAIICTFDSGHDCLLNVYPVLPALDTHSIRSYMFVILLAKMMAKHPQSDFAQGLLNNNFTL